MQILFLNHKVKNCGVYQYGHRLFEILNKSKNISYKYIEVDSLNHYNNILNDFPEINGIIYNYHCSTMSWLNAQNIQKSVKNIGILHECENTMFDIIVNIDPEIVKTKNSFSIPRPIFENINSSYIPTSDSIKEFIYFENGSPIFGSFGFGFANKGFDKIVELVNKNYNEAIIKFVIPIAHFDPNKNITNTEMVQKCHSLNRKPGIKLLINHEFFSNEDILKFLQTNTINLFLYDNMQGRGISSTIDYALSVKRPLGISNSYMFRNIYSEKIDVFKTDLKEIMDNSVQYCSQFLEKYSRQNVIKIFENNLLNYNSQILQDFFSIYLCRQKRNGYYLEIGSNHPIIHNNTYLMYKDYNWKGLMVEYDSSFEQLYKEIRPLSYYHIGDARNVPYKQLLEKYNFPLEIDYLQIDLDVNNRSTLDVLELLDDTVLDTYKFATITFEHDIYTGDYFDTRNRSRQIFLKRGYHLLFADVSVFYNNQYCQFEDWYIHPDLVKIKDLKTYEKMNCDEIRDILKNL